MTFSFGICRIVNKFWNQRASPIQVNRGTFSPAILDKSIWSNTTQVDPNTAVNITFTFNLSDCGNQCSARGKITDNKVENDSSGINTRLTADFLQCLPTTATKLYYFAFIVEWLSSYRLLTIKLYVKWICLQFPERILTAVNEFPGIHYSILALITKFPFKYLTLVFHGDSTDIKWLILIYGTPFYINININVNINTNINISDRNRRFGASCAIIKVT